MTICNQFLAGGAPMERRKAKRYWVSAPAVFRWEQPQGTIRKVTGTTRDISCVGVAIVADTAPPVGAPIQLEIRLPPMAVTGKTAAQLHGEGQTVRLEKVKEAIKAFAAEAVFQTKAHKSDGLL
jgi:hypothetical protein